MPIFRVLLAFRAEGILMRVGRTDRNRENLHFVNVENKSGDLTESEFSTITVTTGKVEGVLEMD